MTETPAPPSASGPSRPKPENLWLNLFCNILVPVLVLSKLSTEERLGPMGALVVGLAFPLGYGIYDLIKRRKWNLFSGIGLLSVGLTGGLGLMKVDSFWFAVKEAALPLVMGVAVVATAGSRRPLLRELFLNESTTDVGKIEAALSARGSHDAFQQLVRRSTWGLAASFLVSAVLLFVLTRFLVTSPSGSPEFIAEVGRQTWVSFVVMLVVWIGTAGVVFWKFFAGITELTGLTLDEMLHQPPPKEQPAAKTE
jgi:hypothetical protein